MRSLFIRRETTPTLHTMQEETCPGQHDMLNLVYQVCGYGNPNWQYQDRFPLQAQGFSLRPMRYGGRIHAISYTICADLSCSDVLIFPDVTGREPIPLH